MPEMTQTSPSAPRSILITGASSGIGEALALHYAAQGVFLALSGRNQERLDHVATQCRQRGAVVETHVIDVADRAAMEHWVIAVDRAHTLDLVIANAGISGGTGAASSIADDGDGDEGATQAIRIFEVNILGVIHTVAPLIPLMKARQSGQIAIIASLAGYAGWIGAPAYSASKGGIRLYGEALRGHLRPMGVRVSVVCPGFVATRMTEVNEYKMPFMVTSKRAASIIAEGLRKNRGRIIFPLRTLLVVRLLAFLPLCLLHRLMAAFPAKPPLNQG